MDQKYNCAVEATLSVIGGKYKSIIIWHLYHRTMRFSELKASTPNVTPKMLTQQLRQLEEDGIIHRQVYPVVPPKTEYSLTEYGLSLYPVVKAMHDWGKRNMADAIVPRKEK